MADSTDPTGAGEQRSDPQPDPVAPGNGSPRGSQRNGRSESGLAESGASGSVDLRWARRQLLLTAAGAVLGVVGLLVAIGGLSRLPLSAADARPYAITAVVAAAVLALACLLILGCWLIQLRRWRTAPETSDVGHLLGRVSLVAHLATFPAVLVTMYGALAGSAMAYWDSPAAFGLGITFILAIFAQILAGSQPLRRSGPPATIPFYLRRLNDKVQSLR
ncbi:hypothetical protein [Microlunatus soli]|uniref:Uncharacterized protein n=1 Tax=Microlunatus soli TaxID=630515 RepID=A0A1H1S7Q5_9ACTN|nr:hypothetical protein [Microlunatus soli]SDS43933.1 hypothetical protein SAMN04489812_1908 [Microlunatus soli]